MNSFVYCCRISDNNKGVEKKVMNTVNAIAKHSTASRALVIRKKGILAHIELGLKLFTLNEKIILLRATPYTMLLMFPGLLYLRLLNKKIIIDVPTPFTNVVQEVKGANIGFVKKRIMIVIMYLTLPFSLFPVHRVLQYSKESKWFSFGIKKKMLEVGNGIDVESIPYKENKSSIKNNYIHITGVANLAYWHGYDRFISSMYEYQKTKNKYNVIFNIVGDGEERIKLEELVNKLNLNNNVIFHGFKDNKSLTEIFNVTHIGLCSLALYRININYASVLKAREYAARGIPFILGCDDFDFKSQLDFVYQCDNDGSNINIHNIVDWYISLDNKYENFEFIRDYAVKNVDYDTKVKKEILSICQ